MPIRSRIAPRWAVALAVLTAPSACVAAPPVHALHGPGACLSLADVKGCAHARGFTNPPIAPGSAAVSADGRSLYITSGNANAIGIVRIDPRNGRLRQDAGPAGCLKELETGPEVKGCAHARGFAGETLAVAISPDDRFVYVSSETDREEHPNARRTVLAVAAFARDETGRLRQLPGADGCVADAALDDCAVVPALGTEFSFGPAGDRVYLGGDTFTVMARDLTTGVLSFVGCQNADATSGCSQTPFGVYVEPPVWAGDVGYAHGIVADVGDALLALRLDASGLPELLPGPGNCFGDWYWNHNRPKTCARADAGFYGYFWGIVPTGDGELVMFNGTDPNDLEDGVFRIWTVRLGAGGAMSRNGAHCLSWHKARGCKRARLLAGASAMTGNARRIYVASRLGVTAVARGRAGALRVLGRAKPVVWQYLPPNDLVSTRDGRFVYAITGDFYGTGTVYAYATNVSAAPTAARTSP